MAKPRLIIFASVLIFSTMKPTMAAMSVHDPANLAKSSEIFNQAKEQFQELQEVRKTTDEQFKAIGALGRITLPMVNATSLARQLKNDMQCLMPDFKKLMPSLTFEDVNLSICDRSAYYMNALWFDPDEVVEKFEERTRDAQKILTRAQFQEMSKAREQVRLRRQENLVETLSKGLAQADQALENSKKNSDAIDDLEASASDAEDAQTRMAVTAQTSVIQARIANQQLQLMAQQLRVMSAIALEAGVPIERYGVSTEEQKEGN